MQIKMPKKRYILAAVAFAYLVAKVYVLQTPSKCDDDLPDRVKSIVLQVLANQDEDANPADTDSQSVIR